LKEWLVKNKEMLPVFETQLQQLKNSPKKKFVTLGQIFCDGMVVSKSSSLNSIFYVQQSFKEIGISLISVN